MTTDLTTLSAQFASSDPGAVRAALQAVREEISRRGSEQARPLFEMVSSLFYIDPQDDPELATILDEAISLVTGFGPWVIPHLVENLDQGDLKAQMASAEALGRIGADAVDPLIERYHATRDAESRAFVVYALGKIRSPRVAKAADIALAAARSPDLELRDTATRAIGRFAASIPPGELGPAAVTGYYETLRKNLSDPNKGVKAKALRSLGKLARYGHLDEKRKGEMETIVLNLLGEDDEFRWDRAFVVRREAREALEYFRDQTPADAQGPRGP